MIICRNCGERLPDGAWQCTKCGQILTPVQPRSSAPTGTPSARTTSRAERSGNKFCPECGYVLPMQAKICSCCRYNFTRSTGNRKALFISSIFMSLAIVLIIVLAVNKNKSVQEDLSPPIQQAQQLFDELQEASAGEMAVIVQHTGGDKKIVSYEEACRYIIGLTKLNLQQTFASVPFSVDAYYSQDSGLDIEIKLTMPNEQVKELLALTDQKIYDRFLANPIAKVKGITQNSLNEKSTVGVSVYAVNGSKEDYSIRIYAPRGDGDGEWSDSPESPGVYRAETAISTNASEDKNEPAEQQKANAERKKMRKNNVSDDEFIKYAKSYLFGILKDPGSATIYAAEVHEKDSFGRAIVYIDVSSRNGFGGSVRDKLYICITGVYSDETCSLNATMPFINADSMQLYDLLKKLSNFNENPDNLE